MQKKRSLQDLAYNKPKNEYYCHVGRWQMRTRQEIPAVSAQFLSGYGAFSGEAPI
jgi:hypothetical protein